MLRLSGIILLFMLALQGCGHKGGLYQPGKPAETTAAGTSETQVQP